MKKKKSRLDVPGFSFGIKTGEFIDVPKLYGGRPKPKKSGIPHTLPELQDLEAISRNRKAIRLATRIAKEDYFRRKRNRFRELKKAITIDGPIMACNRRFLEFMGMKAGFIPYVEKPELFISRSKIAYEITDGFCPIVTTTSAREALIICASLARYGVGAYINRITVPYR